MTPLPIPNAEALLSSQLLHQHIALNIRNRGGWLSFAEFMHMALYTPSLGYYTGGGQKFGDMQNGGGDFVTAPQISALFANTLANQVAQVLAELNHQKLNGFAQTHTSANAPKSDVYPNILELGAGTGQLACDLLLALNAQHELPNQYFILEVSDHLRCVQRENLQKKCPEALFSRVVWLDSLPMHFNGVVLANEVLDALPVHLVHHQATGLFERGVSIENDHFVFKDEAFIPNAHQQSISDYAKLLDLPDGYVTEFCPAASGLMASMANILQAGAIFLIDYGFSAREYYHPQRNAGTLMCHYQQLAHTNPLVYVGLQDITAHVDFTKVAMTALDHDLTLAGFCSQAQFLMNCGILDALSQVSPTDMARYAPLAAAAQKLLSPAEMGDLFKVIGFSKHLDTPLLGFLSADKSHTL
jgi:SAM-dependent MidA family methyltransferase